MSYFIYIRTLHFTKHAILFFVAALIFLVGCDDNPVSSSSTTWKTAPPESQGLDVELLDLRTADFDRARFGAVQSILVARNGFLVYEKYYQGGSQDRLFPLFSATKGVTSALLGVAHDNGDLPELSTNVLGIFSDKGPFEHMDTRKHSITLNDVLQMRAGLAWNELSTGSRDPGSSAGQLAESTDWIKFVLDQPMQQTPGAGFAFNSGLSLLLSGAIQQATGQSAASYAERHLFTPLGITDYEWDTTPTGLTNAAWGLSLRSRDLAKIGQLYLDRGQWGTTRVLPASWVDRAMTPVSDLQLGLGYADHWWLRALPRQEPGFITYVSGRGGQYLYLVPAYNLLVVFTGKQFDDPTLAQRLLFDFVMPVIESLDAD